MAIVYHSTSANVKPGDRYIGSDREKLSELLGGPVAFCYAFPFGNWELAVDDDALCIASLNREDIPRRDYDCCTFEEALGLHISNKDNVLILDNSITQLGKLPYPVMYAMGTIADVLLLEPKGEIAVLASNVTFGNKR